VKVVAYDTETALIRPGKAAAELVCMTYVVDGGKPSICLADEACALLRGWLQDPECTLVGHNVAYDEAVPSAYDDSLLPLFFEAHLAGRITDTMLRERLIMIASGQGKMHFSNGKWTKTRYDLGSVSAKYTGALAVNKEDPWRLRYAELRGTPLSHWPDEAKGYALADASATWRVYAAQERAAPDPVLRDQYRQTYHAFALQLCSVWGLRTDEASVAAVRAGLEERREELRADLVAAGLVRSNGSKDTKRAAALLQGFCTAKGIAPALTKTGGIQLDADACSRVEEPLFSAYADWSTVGKMLSNDVAMLEKGMHEPIHSRFFLAETGRSISSKPNIQNVSKKLGVREGFVPRRGLVYLQCDIPGLELHTLAECCHIFCGYSKLGDALAAGRSPHNMMAGRLLNQSEEWITANGKDPKVKEMRQLSKALNFGLPGGLGADRFIDFARAQYGVSIDKAAFKILRGNWLEQWPEMSDYFAYANGRISERGGTCTLLQPYSYRVRGGCSYTVACNGPFQAMGADLAKAALCEIQRRCYVEKGSELYGSRTVNFVHDEYILETSEARLHEKGAELADAIVEIGNVWIPRVPFIRSKFEPTAMRRWSKNAEVVLVDGRLQVWGAKP